VGEQAVKSCRGGEKPVKSSMVAAGSVIQQCRPTTRPVHYLRDPHSVHGREAGGCDRKACPIKKVVVACAGKLVTHTRSAQWWFVINPTVRTPVCLCVPPGHQLHTAGEP